MKNKVLFLLIIIGQLHAAHTTKEKAAVAARVKDVREKAAVAERNRVKKWKAKEEKEKDAAMAKLAIENDAKKAKERQKKHKEEFTARVRKCAVLANIPEEPGVKKHITLHYERFVLQSGTTYGAICMSFGSVDIDVNTMASPYPTIAKIVQLQGALGFFAYKETIRHAISNYTSNPYLLRGAAAGTTVEGFLKSLGPAASNDPSRKGYACIALFDKDSYAALGVAEKTAVEAYSNFIRITNK